jgi:hypothetical protein
MVNSPPGMALSVTALRFLMMVTVVSWRQLKL